jgi:nitrogenase molybdenum-iron protein beta chain
VFGGQANLLAALQTIFAVYDPEIVAVHTTCLSETIGDDIPTIVAKAREDGSVPAGRHVIHANTPSYVGSHITGFSNMAAAMVNYLAEAPPKRRRKVPPINVVPGYVDPSDMREIRRLTELMGFDVTMFPDTVDVLDTPQTGQHHFYPKGGVTVDQLRQTGAAVATVALGRFASRAAAVALETKCHVPREVLELPIGLSATDRLMTVLRARAKREVPQSLLDERGRLVDMMGDTHQHLYGKKVALFGDPDHVIALTEFLVDLNMKPVHVLTGTPGNAFETRVKEILGKAVPQANVRAAGDLFLLHQWMKNEPVDLLIGNTYGKYIARAEDVPLVRFGWPIIDRVGHTLFPSVGYVGAMRLLERMLDALLERRDRDAPEHAFELVL